MLYHRLGWKPNLSKAERSDLLRLNAQDYKLTSVVVHHRSDILALVAQVVLPHDLQLPVLGEWMVCADMHPDYMQTSVVRRAGEAVNSLEHAHTFHSCVMLPIRMPWFGGDVTLEPRRIPHLDGFIIRTRHEEKMVGRDGQTSDAVRVRAQVCDEGRFRAMAGPVPYS